MAVILPRTYNTYFITPQVEREKNAVMNEWMHVYVQRFSVSFPAWDVPLVELVSIMGRTKWPATYTQSWRFALRMDQELPPAL